ncbi:MAG: sulfotransferase [Mycobacterium sp.]|nr:sulfotransferase [Mycobacterium sp.]
MSGPATMGRAAVRSVTRTVGRLTHTHRLRPHFLVVGAQRCGTTSMMKTLAQHPGVVPAVFHKGVHYFDVNYDRGPAWYAGHFPTAWAARRTAGPAAVTGESSPYYMFHPLAPERIAADLPDVRIIVLLRDPVERAYSAHAHERARGFEPEEFAAALDLEPGRLAGEVERLRADPGYDGHHWRHHAYVTRGRYVEQLEHLEAEFGRDRMSIVDSQDFFDDPAPVFAAVERFLGLPPATGIAFERHNARPRAPMPAGLRARLDEHFRPYDARLAAWWGRTPSWRR